MGGQGLILEQNSNYELPFFSWYTLTPGMPGSVPQGERLRWFTLQPDISQFNFRAAVGTYSGNTIRLKIFRTTGGVFNSSTPATTSTVHVGDATVTAVTGAFSGSCNEVDFRYKFFANAGEFAGLPLAAVNVDDLSVPATRMQKLGAAGPGCTGP